MVKYRAAVTIAPPTSTVAHCLMPDISPKFIAIGPPLRLSLLASQRELERLHVLDLLVLISFLDLDTAEETGLLQIRDQVCNRIRTQRGTFQTYTRSLIVHLAQPHSFGVVDRFPEHGQQVDRTGQVGE